MNMDFFVISIRRVVMIDKLEYSEKIIHFPKQHSYHNELIFHFSGKSTVYFNKQILNTYPNTIRFLPPGMIEKYVVDREERGMSILINFTSSKPLSEEAFVLNNENIKHIAPLFKKIFSIWISKQEGYYFECISILYKILARIQKNTYMPKEKFSRIKPAVDYIQENFTNENISSEILQKLCGISYSYIKKLFVEKFGMTPKPYTINLRMTYAGELLSSGLYSITQIAVMCGYEDLSFFNRQFKKHYNLTPTEYTKKYKSSK